MIPGSAASPDLRPAFYTRTPPNFSRAQDQPRFSRHRSIVLGSLFSFRTCLEVKRATKKKKSCVDLHVNSSRSLCSGQQKLRHAAADLRDVLTLQVLHSHVADLPDKFLPLEPVCPAASSHLEPRTEPQGPGKDRSQRSPGWRRRRGNCCSSGQEGAIVQPVGSEPRRH